MAAVKVKKEGKVPNFLSKMPKFHFSFGSSSKNQQKKEEPPKSPKVVAKVADTNVLSTNKDLSVEKKSSPNLSSRKSPNFSSRRSSKFSSNSPEIAKLRKNLLNAQEKHRIESFSVTTTKIPILRAKIRDSSNAIPTVVVSVKNSSESSNKICNLNAERNEICAKNFFLENQNASHEVIPQSSTNNLFDIRTKSTRAENFFRPIGQPSERDVSVCPKKFESPFLTKPNSSMNTKDFLAAFMAEKGTCRPIVQRGLVRERAKVFEQKIEEIKETIQVTPRPISREQHQHHREEGKLFVPRPTSFVPNSRKNFVGLLGPSPSVISGSGAWSSWSATTPASTTSISANQKLDESSRDSTSKPVRGTTAQQRSSAFTKSPMPQSQSSGSGAWSSWSASTPASSTSISAAPIKPIPLSVTSSVGQESSSYGQSPATPASHSSFVPHSISSGSGAWSSWSASTPPSSVSISGVAQRPIESGPSSLESPRGPDVQHKSEVRQDNFVPITGSMVWSWKSPGKRKPERVSEKSDVLPPLPPKGHNQMTSSTTSSKGSCKTNSSPMMSEGENKANDYFDDDYNDQPDLTLNSLHEVSEGPIATGGGESDAHELCRDIFVAKNIEKSSKNLEKSSTKRHKDSSLSASIESLELDDEVDNNNSNVKNNNSCSDNNNRQVDVTSSEENKSCHELMRPEVMPISSWKKPNERLLPATLDERSKSIPSMYLLQDINSIKSYLNKLRKILQEGDEGVNLSPENGMSTSAKLSLVQTEEEITDLKKQIATLRQQNFEKDRQIESLKRQLAQSQIGQKSSQTAEAITSSLFYLPSETLINSSGETSSTGSSPIRPQ